MVAAAFGGEFQTRLEMLAPDPETAQFSDVDKQVLKAFGVKKV